MLPSLVLVASLIRGPADVASLTAAADAVVHAQVVRRTSAPGVAGGQLFTTVVLRPLETWKGQPARQVTVLVPGGSVGDLSQTVSGAPRFQDGEEVVVFLHRRASGIYSVERSGLGKYAVKGAPGAEKRAVRSREGLECAGCREGEQDELSLDELRARVLGSQTR